MLERRTYRWLAAAAGVCALGLSAAGGCAGGTEVIEDDGSGASDAVVTTTGGSGGGPAGTGGANLPCGVDCAAIATPQCQVAQCNGVTLQCEVVNDEDGVACDDGVFCTISDSCSAGMCVGGPQNDCGMTPPPCTEVTCDETSQMCSTAPAMNGAPCQEADLCIKGSTCTNGLCLGGMLDNCFFEPVPDDCHVSVCDSSDGICKPEPGNEGLPCTDLNDLCTINKTCMTGVCQGGTAMDCSHLTQNCDIGICDTTNGTCTTMSVPNGQPCDDLSACTTGETCNNQMCTNGTPVTLCEQNGDGCCPTNCNASNDLDCAVQPSCKDIKNTIPASVDGVYTIDPDGPGPAQQMQVFCDMTTEGGGWTLTYYVDAAHFDGVFGNNFTTNTVAPNAINAQSDVWNAELVMTISESILVCTSQNDAQKYFWRYSNINPHTYWSDPNTNYLYQQSVPSVNTNGVQAGGCVASHKQSPYGFMTIRNSGCGSCSALLWGMYHYWTSPPGCNSTSSTYGAHPSPWDNRSIEYPICNQQQTSNGRFWVGVR